MFQNILFNVLHPLQKIRYYNVTVTFPCEILSKEQSLDSKPSEKNVAVFLYVFKKIYTYVANTEKNHLFFYTFFVRGGTYYSILSLTFSSRMDQPISEVTLQTY